MRMIKLLSIALFPLWTYAQSVPTQAPKPVILQGFYLGPFWTGREWDTLHTWAVPCPADTLSYPSTQTWYYDRLAEKASEIASRGFTAVWFPSVAKGSGGSYGHPLRPHHEKGGIYDVGYGVFDDYDLGDKLQKGALPTRYGSREQLTRCVAIMRANGLDVYHDFILNQRNGSNLQPAPPAYQWFGYKNAFGADSGGRFPKYTRDFHNGAKAWPASPGGNVDPHTPGNVYPDGTPTGGSEHYWGPDFAHITGQRNINGVPGVWCAVELCRWGDWLLRATGMQGYRLDDVSGISWDYVKEFMNYGSMKGKFSVAELAGTPWNAYELKQWLQELTGRPGNRSTMFDQLLQPVLLKMCKTDRFDMTFLQTKYLAYSSKDPAHSFNAVNANAGVKDPGKGNWYRSLMAVDPEQAVTVLNEVDMETPIGTMPRVALPKECLPGYAYILTIGEGIPCISSKDWNTDIGCYGSTPIDGHTLNYHLNKLLWCHNFVCTGNLTNEQVSSDGTVYAFEHQKKAIVFINTDRNNPAKFEAFTSIPDGTELIDYTDHDVKALVQNGKISITVPANKDGRGYLVMATPGITGSFSLAGKTTTQEWDASEDLSIRPAGAKKQLVCRIWVDKGTPIVSTLLDYNTTRWSPDTKLLLEIDRSSDDGNVNEPVATRTFNNKQKGETLQFIDRAADHSGYYSLWVTGIGLPDTVTNWWFNLQNTYMSSGAPKPLNF
ncbi:MAG TPA: hypothetical protein VHD83_15800 [Puia sp.]|nr:hypothetical protein [Puia sp.]